MPKGPRETTESEREQAYHDEQRRGRGEKLQGDEAEFLEEAGEAGEVKKEREERGGSS